MRKIALSVLIVWLFVIAACAPYSRLQAPAVEIEGFRGIKWGTPVDQLRPEMVFVGRNTGRDIEWYTRKDEDLFMGEATVESISYFFYQNLFNKVNITARGADNYEALKDYLLAKYGKATKSIRETYIWSLEKTLIMFAYNPSTEVSRLIFQEREGQEKRTPRK